MSQSHLNLAQREAVEYTDGPLLIVAGAGTGKTTVIIEKISHLIKKGLTTPEEILALTFTDKAAQEMQDRVDRMLDIGYVDLQISTFHAFCERLLRQYGLDIGISLSFKLLSDTNAWLLMYDYLYDLKLDYYRPLGNPTKHIHELLKHFSKCKDELISPIDYLKYAEGVEHDAGDDNVDEKSRLTEIANAYHKYNQLLLDNNALDFGDLIFYAVKLLRERPKIRESLQKRFKHVLVDEFQDVNWAQYELVKLLVGHGQLTVVGDDDQSIYAFRGASVSNILRFKDDFPNSKEIVLNKNYRSGQEILDIAYKSIQNNNPDRLEVKLGVEKKLLAMNKEQETRNKNTQKLVSYFSCLTLGEEVNTVIREIVSLKEKYKDAAWDDFAILVRANSQAEPFIQGLERAKIPYEFLSAAGLYRQPIVLDCFSFFKVIEHYHESTAVYRLLNLPFFEFKENDLQKFSAQAKKKSVPYYEGLKHASEWQLSEAGIATCAKVIELIHVGMKQARTEKSSFILFSFLETSGYLAYLTHEEEQGNQLVIHQIYQLKQFFDFINKYEETTPNQALPHFVKYFNSIIESGDEGKLYQSVDTPDSVNILTAHSAKGLEFRFVFIVNLVEDRFPTRKRGETIEIPLSLIHEQLPEGDFHYQEERRLFYVAMTRAKERLYLTSAENYGGARQKKISRFLAEIGYVGGEPPTTDSEQKNRNLTIKQFNHVTVIDPAAGLLISQDHKPFIYELPVAFSFSQIKAYETCPYQYKLAHILKIPTKGNASLSFGSALHATLQKFYGRIQELNLSRQGSLFTVSKSMIADREVKAPPLAELLELYEKNWISDWYKNKRQREEYYAKGKEILRMFYAAEAEKWTVPVSLEGWFKIKVGDYLVHGRIDRVDKLSDGTLEIIDYKTGASKEKIIGDDKDQLLIYQIAASTLPEYSQIGQPSKLTFYYLNDTIKTSFIGDDKDLAKIKDKLVAAIDAVHSNDFTPTPNQHVCKYCDFRDICEHRII